ncbi:MAG: hypothetical protein JWO38_5987 [Gemmataceae bacterium]|nr:hypothetical protein [Gemmataceae bacterium]
MWASRCPPLPLPRTDGATLTANPSPAPPHPRWRRRLLPLTGLVLVGVGLFIFYRPTPRPTPPDPKADNLEPAVVSSVRAAREQVLAAPSSAKAWGYFGEVLLANELEDEARICFTEAERLEPGTARWPYLRAVPLLNRGDAEAAVTHLRRAVELADEQNQAPRLVLAETLLLLGRPTEAEPHIRHAREQKPDDPRARFDAGLLAAAGQDWETARGHLLGCLDSPYSRQRARVHLAAVCRRLGDAAKADDYQAEADRLPPDWDWVDPTVAGYQRWAVKKKNSYKIAESLEAQGRFAEAVRVVAPVAEEYPDDDTAQLELGRLLAQKGDYQEAEVALRRARQLAPHKVHAHYYLSLVRLQLGEAHERAGDKTRAGAYYQDTASLARAALAVKPDYGFAHMALGLALKHLGRPAEALTELQQAVLCSPEYAEIHKHLADLLADLGRRDEARVRYEQALRLAPPEAPWRAAAQARLADLQKPAKKPGG